MAAEDRSKTALNRKSSKLSVLTTSKGKGGGRGGGEGVNSLASDLGQDIIEVGR